MCGCISVSFYFLIGSLSMLCVEYVTLEAWNVPSLLILMLCFTGYLYLWVLSERQYLQGYSWSSLNQQSLIHQHHAQENRIALKPCYRGLTYWLSCLIYSVRFVSFFCLLPFLFLSFLDISTILMIVSVMVTGDCNNRWRRCQGLNPCWNSSPSNWVGVVQHPSASIEPDQQDEGRFN